MTAQKQNSVGLSLASDRFTLVSSEAGIINAVESRELIQPFEPKNLQAGDGVLENFQDVIQTLVKKAKAEGADAAIVLDSNMVALRRTLVPIGLNESELSAHLTWEAAQTCASELKEFSLASERLHYQNSAGNPFYLQVLLRKAIIRAIKKIVSQTGLQLKDIDVDIFSHIRSLNANFNLDLDSLSLLICFEKKAVKYLFLKGHEFYISNISAIPAGYGEISAIPLPELGEIIIKKIRQYLFGHKLGKSIEDISRTFILASAQTTSVMDTLTNAGMQHLVAMSPLRKIQIRDALKSKDEPISQALHVSASLGGAIKLDPALKGNAASS